MPTTSKTTHELSHAVVDLLADSRRQMQAAEIASKLGVSNRASLKRALEALVYDGLVLQSGRRYGVAATAKPQTSELEGAFSAHPRGFGFVRGGASGDDLYISPESIAGAMHGDIVRARVVGTSSRGREGEVVEVLDRRNTRIVGMLRGRPGAQRLEPDDGRIRGPIPIVGEKLVDEPSAKDIPALDGVAAVVEISQFPEDARERPNGMLVAVLGEPGEPDVEIAKVMIGHGVHEKQPPEAVKQAQSYGDKPSDKELARRFDLLDVPFLTIDPSDARDHDDAVWVERDDRGHYDAWIAIADVSHYVTPDSPLDESALERICSVYLPDRAIPMLPPELSTHLCSLVEGEVRLCMCVHVKLDPTGAVTETTVHEGKMRSRAYFSYEAVARALNFTTEPSRDARAEELRDDLRVMWDLSSILRKRRMQRGALDLDVPEARIQIDTETRAPVAVTQRGGDPGVRKAYRLIEELMLLANEAVATLMISRHLSTVFRVHGAPDPAKLDRLAAATKALGVELDPDDVGDPKKLSQFLRSVEKHERKGVIHGLLLRTMQQACYDTTNIGHFGLASDAYLHFTSPIRRYPDLVVHRILRASIRGEKKRATEESDEKLRIAAARASELERNAMEVEREVSDVYRSLYMQRHISDRFDGVVTAISPAGLWVRLADPFVDVLVPNDRIGEDKYEMDDAAIRCVGARSGDTITLGDDITLEIEDVSLVRRVTLAKRLHSASSRGERKEDDRKKGKDKGRPTGKERKTKRRAQSKARTPGAGKNKGKKSTRGRSKSASSQQKQSRKKQKGSTKQGRKKR